MPRYTEGQAREAVAASLSYSEALQRLGLRPVCGNHRLFRKWVDEIWQIPTGHFDPHARSREALRRQSPEVPIETYLVEGSLVSRNHLKKRLYREGIKHPICEICARANSGAAR